ncbi:hypothetical protein ACFWJ4_34980 [Kitasatospora sp. NPDC127067]|uniref:hypothetical protein n=1 Tax=Kitasatospora sp. NPDC127067 TaxID=3347126 RepID=UPI00365B25A0
MISVIRKLVASTAFSLAFLGVTVGCLAWLITPDANGPKTPRSPIFAIKPGPNNEALAPGGAEPSVTASIAVRAEQGAGMCAQFYVSGAALDVPGWQIEVAAEPEMLIHSNVMSIHPAGGSSFYVLSRGPGFVNTGEDEKGEPDVHLCWNHPGDPTVVSHRGSRAAINMPNFYVDWRSGKPPPDASNVRVSIKAQLDDIGDDWAVDSGTAPNPQLSTAKHWVWESPIDASDTRKDGSPATLQVHSLGEAESEHNREFYSGIFYGVGAAALIAAIQERLNTRRRAEPNGTS